jgi:hypothetical protein
MLRENLHKEAERLVEDSNFTARGNLHAGREWTGVNTWLGLPAEISAAVLAGGAGLTALLDGNPCITAGLAFIAAALGAARVFLKPSEKAAGYSHKGTRMIGIRNQARIFRDIDLNTTMTGEQLAARIKELRREYDELLSVEPTVIHDRHYQAAKRGIEAGESEYAVDKKQ